MKSITVKKATLNDKDDVFIWRNDQQAIEMSLSNDSVSRSEHSSWFDKKIKSDKTLILIGYCQNQKIGMTRFDLNKNENIISINLDPISRGKGLSSLFLKESIEYFIRSQETTHSYIKAKIKANNIPSIKSFTRAGFIKEKEFDDHLIYSLKLI